MKLTTSMSVILFFMGCSQMVQKSPPLAWNEKFYRLSMEKEGIIFERQCKNRVGDRRDCEIIEHDLIKDWNKYSPDFIVIPYKLVYP